MVRMMCKNVSDAKYKSDGMLMSADYVVYGDAVL